MYLLFGLNLSVFLIGMILFSNMSQTNRISYREYGGVFTTNSLSVIDDGLPNRRQRDNN